MTLKYIVRRIANGVVTVVSVATLVFLLTHAIGNPVISELPPDATRAEFHSIEARYGLDRSLATQYVNFIEGAATLNFGQSLSQGQPAIDVVRERLARTLLLVALGIALAVLVALPLGIIAAFRPGSRLDNFTVTLSLLGLSLPQFWLGAMLILFFAVDLRWLPAFGGPAGVGLVLPAVTLALPAAGAIAQMVRSTMIDELQRAYVLAARARGIPYFALLWRHVLRNAAVPIVSFLSLETAVMLAGGTVIVETVYAYPGLGQLAVQAAQVDDSFLLEAIVMVVALLVVATNLATDLVHAVIDPRIRLAR